VIKIVTNFNRSNITESSHKIKLLVKDLKGETLITTNDENDFIYPRSSIKIFQAIPFVTSNAIANFNFNKKIIALSCSSHRGEAYHIKELERWLNKIKIKLRDLKCGLHYPLNISAKEKILRSNSKINQLFNNCAGKHLAMLSSCIVNGYNIKDYLSFNHPHQIEIRKIFEQFSETKINKKNYGVDGCSAPQYSFKIKDISKLLINLIKSYKNNFKNSYETKVLIDSIINNPNYIGGSDSLDSRIMKIASKKIFCKGGAEGVFLFIDLEKEISGVIKVVDGNERAIPSVVFDLFKKFKIFNKKQQAEFKKQYNFQLNNHAKITIGSIKTNIL
tara:strand:+ start:1555 stop:2550 length:996 start_codon:yes stop_codon:yes gene_type:complete